MQFNIILLGLPLLLLLLLLEVEEEGVVGLT
jgi:hypothetical protein